ncbi:MAG: hypothetical protein SWX82_13095 [Cyanobacteriota bacterium]|nr:hypothetical protein [Cyanobacteriota bacterium]
MNTYLMFGGWECGNPPLTPPRRGVWRGGEIEGEKVWIELSTYIYTV